MRTITLSLIAFVLSTGVASARSVAVPEPERQQPVDLVIALDVSGSMSGLIDSAKQRLWDVVNDIGQAQPTPDLRIAVLTFGNPGYGAQTGYVRIDQPFTRDLDAVNRTLFSFGTNGGDEYVARVLDRAMTGLDWSSDADALKVVFVAGNESARQDPHYELENVLSRLREKGIAANAIYCGNGQDDIAPEWQLVAQHGNGVYASIDQNAAAVARIDTPYDQELVVLNQKLNETYVAYGERGRKAQENQVAQDANAEAMSAPAAASRAVAKAGNLYRSSDWDLVDALEEGAELDQVPEEALPEPMRQMSENERKDFVAAKAEERAQVKKEIGELAARREAFIQAEREKQQTTGLDDALVEGLRKLAKDKGFAFEPAPGEG